MAGASIQIGYKVIAPRFPAALDRFPNPRPDDTLDQTPAEDLFHDVQHRNVNDAVYAIQKRIGVTGSTDPASLEYRISRIATRLQASVAASGLAPDSTSSAVTLPLGKMCSIFRITADKAAWIRIYSSAAARAADATRLSTVDPTGEHGVLLEVILEASNLTLDLAPVATCWNAETPAGTDVYLSITNNGATTGVTVSVDYIPIEV